MKKKHQNPRQPTEKAAAARGKNQEAPKVNQKLVQFIDIPDSKKMGDDAIKQNINFIRKLYGPIIDATDNKMADTESIYKDSYTTKPICLSLYNKDAMKGFPLEQFTGNSQSFGLYPNTCGFTKLIPFFSKLYKVMMFLSTSKI